LFYRDVLGMELLYGGEAAGFSSLRARDAESAILNLEHGVAAVGWGRLIVYVADVDSLWAYLCEKGFHPERAARCRMGRTVFPHARPGRT